MDGCFRKAAGGILIPENDMAAAKLNKIKTGDVVTVNVKRMNNYKFHKRMFALFNLAFESWEPAAQEYKGAIVQKNFDQFRKDLTILAGYYESTINLRGEVRLIAKSLNFSAMGQEEREACYSAIINVILAKLLTNYTRDDLDAVVERVLQYS